MNAQRKYYSVREFFPTKWITNSKENNHPKPCHLHSSGRITFLNLLFYSRIPSQGQERGPRAFSTTNTHSLWRASTPRHHGNNKQWQKDNLLVRWSASYGNHFDRAFNSEEGRFSMFQPRDLIFCALTWFISYAKCEKSRWTLSLFLRCELETLFRKGGFYGCPFLGPVWFSILFNQGLCTTRGQLLEAWLALTIA